MAEAVGVLYATVARQVTGRPRVAVHGPDPEAMMEKTGEPANRLSRDSFPAAV